MCAGASDGATEFLEGGQRPCSNSNEKESAGTRDDAPRLKKRQPETATQLSTRVPLPDGASLTVTAYRLPMNSSGSISTPGTRIVPVTALSILPQTFCPVGVAPVNRLALCPS